MGLQCIHPLTPSLSLREERSEGCGGIGPMRKRRLIDFEQHTNFAIDSNSLLMIQPHELR